MEKDIGKIAKNPETDIVIRVDDFGGKVGLTIREYANSATYKGFTKSGTKIAAEHFKAFKDMINSIDEKDFATQAKPKQEKLSEVEDGEPTADDSDLDSGIDEDGLM